MSYESTIGNTIFIFSISIPATFQTISDCMTADQRAAIAHLDVLDGYIVPTGNVQISHENPQVIGTVEPFASGATISFPLLNWHQKVFIKSVSGTIPALMKVIVGFERRN